MTDNAGVPPRRLWASLEDLEHPERFEELLRHEFPWKDSEHVEGMDRREFWRVMGAAVAMASMTACTKQPPERIVPYVNQPPEMVQGKPLFFATAMPQDGDALGLVVKSHMGHPVKVEGNPRHPSSLGGTDYWSQASLLSLYDPERSPTVEYQGRIGSWLGFIGAMGPVLEEQNTSRGERMRLLTGTVVSPTVAAQIAALQKRFPGMRLHQWEPVNRDNARRGCQMAFGQIYSAVYHYDKADVIVALDGEFLLCGPGNVRYARDFALRRGSRNGARMNRLYAVESTFTTTGASADHRLALKQSEMEAFARGIAQGVGAPGGAAAPEAHAKWVSAVAKDLLAHRGAGLVVAGDGQPAAIHALCHAINGALGNLGNTVTFIDSVEFNPTIQSDSLGELAADMKAGKVDLLVILDGNPVYDAPADLDFAGSLAKVRHKIHLAAYSDETSAACEWHIPKTHFLEEWGDCQAFDGTASIIQPLIAPLYQGRSATQVLSVLLGQPDASPYETVRAYWRGRNLDSDFERLWTHSLHDGVVAGTAYAGRQPALRGDLAAQLGTAATAAGGGYEILFRPDPTIWDGRYANNGYLQELPKPVTKLTWDAVALISPATARKIDCYSTGVVELKMRGRQVQFPLWVQPGHADDTITVHLGYGRSRAGKVGNTGFNAYPLRVSEALWWGAGAEVRKTGEWHQLACTQQHMEMAGRYPVRMGTLERFQKDPEFAHKEPFEEEPRPSESLYPEWRYPGYKWGMAIDLNACTGCNACVMACNLENNIPIVGKEQVFRGRIMHWLRIDRYFEGWSDKPRAYFQPTPCMQCENAPCELVCPVNATVHSSEGLNQMVYNRCVGTRYCSNNCPYKVRRFNFFLFSDWYTDSLALMRNPDVSVRSRGVMEKCSYCIQRIEEGKIEAEKQDRPVRDGEVRTACQQACPTQAIIFGDINDEASQVRGLKKQPLNYGLLADLNTRPRTTYLAKVMNLNPDLAQELT